MLCQVLGTVADPSFGARNFDRMLLHYFAKMFQGQKGIDILENKKATQRLLVACEKCKSTLSANSSANVNVECIVDDFDLNGKVTREELEEQAKPLLEQAMVTVNKLMTDLGFSPEQENADSRFHPTSLTQRLCRTRCTRWSSPGVALGSLASRRRSRLFLARKRSPGP